MPDVQLADYHRPMGGVAFDGTQPRPGQGFYLALQDIRRITISAAAYATNAVAAQDNPDAHIDNVVHRNISY